MKDKVEMTQDLINQLHKDGWLSKKLKQEYELNHIGDGFNYQELLIVCKDYDFLDKLFEDKIEPEQIENVTYKVYIQRYGETEGSPEVFSDVTEAIKHHYKCCKACGAYAYVIQVDYGVKVWQTNNHNTI